MRVSLRLLSKWETVIGLELHIQIKSPTKLFFGTKTSWDDAPNSNVSLFDAGYPGTLPTLSRHPVKQGLLTALALNCHIPSTSQFDRKHYFYHDQPLGYQITQHYHPLALAGRVVLPTNPPKTVRIHQIQLEQDTAKSTTIGREVLIDFNRAGIGLMEIVTEADISSAEEAIVFVKTLRGILRRIGTSDADMDKGSLRVDCNISVNRPGSPRGTRTEIKNLNSLKNLSIAVASEIKRQSALVDAGLPVLQETRGFDESIMDTVSSRSKEGEKDYRYMPDGNLPVLRIDPTYLETLRSSLPELPLDSISRLQRDYPTLSEITPSLLLALDPDQLSAIEFFEDVAKGRDPRLVGNWVSQELVGALSREGLSWEAGGREKVSTLELGEVLDLLGEEKISAVSAKLVLSHLIKAQHSSISRVPSILKHHSLLSLSPEALDQLCKDIVAKAKPGTVELIKSGKKPGLLGGLIGQAMKKSEGRADAKAVGERLKELMGLER